jgi:PAP2 superfamily
MNTSDAAREVEPRHYLAPVVIGVLALSLMFVVAIVEGLPIRDPDARFVGSPLGLIGLIAAGFLVLDVVPRAFRAARSSSVRFREAVAGIFRERWWGRRGLIVLSCLLGFYATYLAYRNLKSYLPFLTSGQQDAFLLDFDRAIFFGQDPATLLHDLLGTGPAADLLSLSYLAFLSFVPISLGVALIWSPRVAAGVWYVTALALDWMIGTLSYYLIPSLGPIYTRPALFSDLPATGVTDLQHTLMDHRLEVIADPGATGAVQSIAAFASLHIAVVFTAALVAQFIGAPRVLRIVLWCYLGLTTLSTVYFGWHYFVDDFAGLAIGGVATFAAAALTGFRRHPLDALARLAQRTARTT